MQVLETTLSLLSRTEGRDKTLRLIQYLTLPLAGTKGPSQNVYEQIWRTRKVLRFLRTLECSSLIRKECSNLFLRDLPFQLRTGLLILENLFTLLFYLSDHRVLLSQLGVIDAKQKEVHYPRSMKCYLLLNIFGILKDIVEIVIIFTENKHDGVEVNFAKAGELIKSKLLDCLKCFIDCFVALHYLRGTISKNVAGPLGVISSVLAILQSLKKI